MQVECSTPESFRTISRSASRRRAAGERLHREGSARRPAGGSGHLLSRAVRGSRVRRPSPASRRSGTSAPRRRRGARSRSSGRAIPPGRAGASTKPAAACGPTRPCCDNRPDFFIHSGDHIYADCPVERELKLPMARSGETSSPKRNREVAADARRVPRQLQIQLLDHELRAFNAEVPLFAQWDDHEVTNDWAPAGTADETGYAETAARCWRPGRAARSTSSCRCAQCPAEAGRIYRKIATARCSTSSCSICAAIAIPTCNQRGDQARPASSGRRSSPG